MSGAREPGPLRWNTLAVFRVKSGHAIQKLSVPRRSRAKRVIIWPRVRLHQEATVLTPCVYSPSLSLIDLRFGRGGTSVIRFEPCTSENTYLGWERSPGSDQELPSGQRRTGDDMTTSRHSEAGVRSSHRGILLNLWGHGVSGVQSSSPTTQSMEEGSTLLKTTAVA
jgi:hypothetical protein